VLLVGAADGGMRRPLGCARLRMYQNAGGGDRKRGVAGIDAWPGRCCLSAQHFSIGCHYLKRISPVTIVFRHAVC
jgi:hypothetical protein